MKLSLPVVIAAVALALGGLLLFKGGGEDEYLDRVPVVFADEIFKGPKIDKTWKFPNDIVVKVMSEDLGERVKKIRFHVTSPDKKSYVEECKPRSAGELYTCHRRSDGFGGVFNFHVIKWVDYRQGDISASGVKIKCTFTPILDLKPTNQDSK
jgi:hypothetical protein